MRDILDFLSRFDGIPPEQWMGLIAITGLLLAFFALYVVLSVITTHRKQK